jgi:hypothetical protein
MHVKVARRNIDSGPYRSAAMHKSISGMGPLPLLALADEVIE